MKTSRPSSTPSNIRTTDPPGGTPDIPSAVLSPLLRAELTIRLTQALDNQLFRTIEQIRVAPTSQEYQALVAISVGHAVCVHDLYVNDFSEDELNEYYAASDSSGADWAAAMADVPLAYRAIRAVGQQIGPMFFDALGEEDRTKGDSRTVLGEAGRTRPSQPSRQQVATTRRHRAHRLSAWPGRRQDAIHPPDGSVCVVPAVLHQAAAPCRADLNRFRRLGQRPLHGVHARRPGLR